ncbi:hypothetical protein [Enterococcus sp. SMC-9]|uniref:hypothetical protein n=1 Tax=Enterococcus sp. SMC-9 TaxID=2862343 RepID=UPI001E4165D2|nr:hypothetical protein [Enterococcus sp. SMC-9]MCD1023455.1 hypothetical protein [Enterococcus sp. SMC-9]
MENILTAATAIGVLVLATTQLIKNQIPNNKWLPVINVVTGIFIGVVYAISFQPADIVLYGWGGFIAGLAAGGFYDLGAGFVKGDK